MGFTYDPVDLIGFRRHNTRNQMYTVEKYIDIRHEKPYYLVAFDGGNKAEYRRDRIITGNIADRTDMYFHDPIPEQSFIGRTGLSRHKFMFTFVGYNVIDQKYVIQFKRSGQIRSYDMEAIMSGDVMDPEVEPLIGFIGYTKQGEEYEVIDLSDDLSYNKIHYLIRFKDTGYIHAYAKSVIERGAVYDPYFPVTLGIGYMGEIEHRDEYLNKAYDTWYDMLARCYSAKHKKYKYYGGKGVTVCKRWHCFANFYADIRALPNYDKWCIANSHEWHLDKDILQSNIPINQKIYSPETCMFVHIMDNCFEMQRRKTGSNTCSRGVSEDYPGKFRVCIGRMNYGTYTNPIAAANVYNFVCRYRGYPMDLMNQVPFMPWWECCEYRTGYRKEMCYLLDEPGRPIRKNPPPPLKEMCKIVEH